MAEPENTSEETQPTLEQLASQFQTAPPQPAPEAREPVASEPPKFDSPEDYQAWSASQLATVSERLNSVNAELEDRKTKEFVETQDKAVNKAIEHIKKDVEMPESFIEGRLHVKYARDENFRKIFDNRDQNPDAYQRALGVVANELKNDSQWQPDPQSAENSRAIQDLQKNANRAPSNEDPNQKYKEMSAQDFDREWERMKNG